MDRSEWDNYDKRGMEIFLALHLITIVPALLIGPFLLARRKGDRLHLTIGRIWAPLMVFSCLHLCCGNFRSSVWFPASKILFRMRAAMTNPAQANR